MKRFLNNALALFFGLILAIVIIFIIETALRYKYNDPTKFFYTLNPQLISHGGIFRRSFLPKKTDPAPRVFCIGGSTTNGNNVQPLESYPFILQYILREQRKNGTVYNFGVNGVSAVATNCFIHNILPQYSPSCVIIHDGYNDVPVVVKKLNKDRYLYIAPDYKKPFNPYIRNPVLRYVAFFVKYNLSATYRFVTEFLEDVLHKRGDVYIGFDYKRFQLMEGTPEDIFHENEKRLKIFLDYEIDSIDFCLKNGIKVIVILEPHIKPYHYITPSGSGFRDENVGDILSECHKIQQKRYLDILNAKFPGEPDLIILDAREIFKDNYGRLFYDECHMGPEGNAALAFMIFKLLATFSPSWPK